MPKPDQGNHRSRQTDKALQESLQRFELLARATNDAVWDWDITNQKAWWNEYMYRLWGYEPGQVVPSYEAWAARIHPADRELVLAGFQRATESGADIWSYEYRYLRPDGSTGYVFDRAFTIRDATGKTVRMLGAMVDVTDRRTAEEQHRRLEAQFQQAQKLESLGLLAGGIAHDFNNLLTSILGHSDLARSELPADSSARRHIEEVVRGARGAAELTQQMLAYSGKGRFIVEPLNLSTLVEEVNRLLQVSISKKCVLKCDLAPRLPSCQADAAQIRQVIMNLIINASEAIGEQGGVIAISTGVMECDRAYLFEPYLDESLAEGLYVYLEVADSGCGMSEETRARIFDPFFTTKFKGRGLGLAAVLGIVRGHRGAIKVHSQLNKGTTFRILLPASGEPAFEVKETGADTADWYGSGTVLIVDDETSVRKLARDMMEKMGFSVVTAADGREGVDLFRAGAARIRLVLLDMTMPLLDGEETLREMRSIRSDVRAILTSGYDEPSATGGFADRGLAGFIQKPYGYEELVTVVRKALAD